MNSNRVIEAFHLRPFGSKGWLSGKLNCPECGKGDKFGVLFIDKGGVARCFYCQQSYPLFKVLLGRGRGDLLDFDYEYTPTSKLPSLYKAKQPVVNGKTPVQLPIGFIRVDSHPYLEERGFTKEQYDQFEVGVAELDPRTENKIVFKINQRGELVGWLARSTKTKEYHHANLKAHKREGAPLELRYRNSNNDFSRMLGGLDEITPQTITLILVEGLFDKANVDRLLGLNFQEEVKCCFTFGSDLSRDQVDLIPGTVQEVILMYDKGTITNMRAAGGKLMSSYQVSVALIKDEEIDPGNMDREYLSQILSNLMDYLYFYTELNY